MRLHDRTPCDLLRLIDDDPSPSRMLRCAAFARPEPAGDRAKPRPSHDRQLYHSQLRRANQHVRSLSDANAKRPAQLFAALLRRRLASASPIRPASTACASDFARDAVYLVDDRSASDSPRCSRAWARLSAARRSGEPAQPVDFDRRMRHRAPISHITPRPARRRRASMSARRADRDAPATYTFDLDISRHFYLARPRDLTRCEAAASSRGSRSHTRPRVLENLAVPPLT